MGIAQSGLKSEQLPITNNGVAGENDFTQSTQSNQLPIVIQQENQQDNQQYNFDILTLQYSIVDDIKAQLKSISHYTIRLIENTPVKKDASGNAYYNITSIYNRFETSKLYSVPDVDLEAAIVSKISEKYPETKPYITIREENGKKVVFLVCDITQMKKKKYIKNKRTFKNKIKKFKYKINRRMKREDIVRIVEQE
jgi:hypothetical protein